MNRLPLLFLINEYKKFFYEIKLNEYVKIIKPDKSSYVLLYIVSFFLYGGIIVLYVICFIWGDMPNDICVIIVSGIFTLLIVSVLVAFLGAELIGCHIILYESYIEVVKRFVFREKICMNKILSFRRYAGVLKGEYTDNLKIITDISAVNINMAIFSSKDCKFLIDKLKLIVNTNASCNKTKRNKIATAITKKNKSYVYKMGIARVWLNRMLCLLLLVICSMCLMFVLRKKMNNKSIVGFIGSLLSPISMFASLYFSVPMANYTKKWSNRRLVFSVVSLVLILSGIIGVRYLQN